MFAMPDDISPSYFCAIHVEGMRGKIEHPLDKMIGLRPPRASIRRSRRGVCDDGVNQSMRDRDVINCRQHAHRIGGRDKGNGLRAYVRVKLQSIGERLAALVEREGCVREVVASLIVRQECF